MSIDKNIWDDQLKNALDGIEGEVPMAAWDAIESSLDSDKRKKRFFFYFTVAALLVIVAGLGFYFSNNEQNNNSAETNEQIIKAPENSVADNKEIETNEAIDNELQDDVPLIDEEPELGNTNTNQKGMEKQKVQELEEPKKGHDRTIGPDDPIDNFKDRGDVSDKNKNSKAKDKSEPGKDKTDIAEDNSNKKTDTTEEPTIDNKKDDVVDDSKKKDPIAKNKKRIKPNKTDSKFEVGLTVNTGIVKQLITENAAESWKLNPRFLDIQEKSINTSGGYVVRLNALYYLNKNFFLSTGLSVSDKRENVSYDFMITEGVSLDPGLRKMEAAIWHPDDYVEVKFNNTNTYKFAEIPFRIGTIVNLSDRWAIRTEVGLNYMHMLQARGNSIDESYLTLKDLSTHPDLKKHSFGAGIKTGLYLTPPQSQFRFGFEAGYDRTLNSIYSDNAAIKVNPYNYGAYFTANYLLRKK